MANFSIKVMSDLQFNIEKAFLFDDWNQVEVARMTAVRWCKINPGTSYKSRTQPLEGKWLFQITKFDHPKTKKKV